HRLRLRDGERSRGHTPRRYLSRDVENVVAEAAATLASDIAAAEAPAHQVLQARAWQLELRNRFLDCFGSKDLGCGESHGVFLVSVVLKIEIRSLCKTERWSDRATEGNRSLSVPPSLCPSVIGITPPSASSRRGW